MSHQTETTSRPGDGRARTRGAALSIVARAPRAGLALQTLCPPLTSAEAGALQTAWLKHMVHELPGVSVFLHGGPADALPMLRYFAGPGVDLRRWPDDSAAGGEPAFTRVARELFAEGHAPVLVRGTNAPEPRETELLACLAAAREQFLLAPDARGGHWLLGFPTLAHVEALERASREGTALPPHARGPWARTIADGDDLALLLQERTGAPCELPVRDVAAAARFHEESLGACVQLAGDSAVVAWGPARVRLRERPDARANGVRLRSDDVAAVRRRIAEHVAIRADDDLREGADGGTAFTVADLDGHRFTFETGPRPR